jgi:two-component sensor histidine kinase
MNSRKRSHLLRTLRQIVVVDIAAGLVGFLTHVSLYHATRSQILGSFAQSQSIAFLIGTPLVLAMARYQLTFARRRFAANLLLLGFTAVGCAIAANLAFDAVSVALGFLRPNQFWDEFWLRIQRSMIIALSITLGMFIIRWLRTEVESATLQLRNRQLEQERAGKLAVEAQLASLESHIRPHFLFNTLNTISSLIPEEPQVAESLVGKLAALLRLSMDSKHERVATLERELKIVTDYLEIERARYGDRLRFRIDVPPELRSGEVPALSIQTLVENSVKYAVGSRYEGAEIRVSASVVDGSLSVVVSDDGPGFTEQAIRPGHGLDNLQRRLTALFGSAARLDISNTAGPTTVTFSLPRTAGKAD